ncbi:MAG: class I SAM-dependent methyltransferase [Myxococcota bacterium]
MSEGALATRDARLRERLLRYIRHAPTPLVIREINRLLAYEQLRRSSDWPGYQRGTILDVGCGDGFWWTLQDLSGFQLYGVDVSEAELGEARKGMRAELCDVAERVPFADKRFDQIMANCSLEHVPDIHGALCNLRSVAADDARLILFLPAPGWGYQGRVQRFLLAHAPRLAMMWSGAINGFFQHWHLYEPPVWRQILADAGWQVEQCSGLRSDRSEALYRRFLPFSFPSLPIKALFKHYPNRLLERVPDSVLRPWLELVAPTFVDPLVDESDALAYEWMIVARPAAAPPTTAPR